MKTLHIITLSFLTLISATTVAQTGPGGVGNSTNNILWLKADELNANNNDSIPTWDDHSGNDHDATSDCAGIYKSSGINNLPAIEFNGSSTNYYLTTTQAIGNAATIFAVCQFDNLNQPWNDYDYIINLGAGNTTKNVSISRTSSDYFEGADLYYSYTKNAGQVGPALLGDTALLINTLHPGDNTHYLYLGGQSQTVEQYTKTLDLNDDINIGRWTDTTSAYGYWLKGKISELIVFDEGITTTERIIIQNYLSSKWGIATTDDKYAYDTNHGNEVFGIGRESSTDKHETAQGSGIVELSIASSLDDGDYFLIGHNGTALSNISTSVPLTYPCSGRRLERTWRIDETGDVGTLTLKFDLTGIHFSDLHTAYELLIDDDGDFTNGGTTRHTTGYSITNDIITFTTVNFADGNYFTISNTVADDQIFELNYAITATTAFGTQDGEIDLTVNSGVVTPYTTSWSNGAATADISDLNEATYVLTLIDSTGRTCAIPVMTGYPHDWEDLTLATFSSNTLTNTNTTDGWLSGAISKNLMYQGEDGSIQHIVHSTDKHKAFGLRDATSTAANTSYAYIDNGFWLKDDGTLYLIDDGSATLVGKYNTGDVLTISRVNSDMIYQKNDVVVDQISIDPSKQLVGIASVYTKDDYLTNLQLDFTELGSQAGPSLDPEEDANFNPITSLDVINKVTIETITNDDLPLKTEADIDALDEERKITNIAYYDGLGRNIQNVVLKGAPDKKDQVQTIVYDQFGRQLVQVLPYNSGATTGEFRQHAVVEAINFYKTNNLGVAKDAYPYTKTKFEASPLSRVIEQGGAGYTYQLNNPNGKTVKANYKSAADLDLIRWTYTYDEPTKSYTLTVGAGGWNTDDQHPTYNVYGRLTMNESVDQHDKLSRTYTDNKGRTLLTRVQDGGTTTPTWTETYYIYDEKDQLILVLPPQANAEPFIPTAEQRDQAFLDTWAFQYQYDERGRMTGKKVPGAGWVYMAYDIWDRLVVTQDANQRAASPEEFTYTKYDILNRPIMTGTLSFVGGGYTIENVRNIINISTNRYEKVVAGAYTDNYTFPVYPPATATIELLTMNYYDNYDYTDISTGTDLSYVKELDNPTDPFDRTRGMLTGTKVVQLGTTNYLVTVNYYDKYGRVIQTRTQNHTGEVDHVTTEYDFAGKAMKTLQETNFGGTSDQNIINERFEYDHMGRVEKAYHKVNTETEILLATNTYNIVGEPVEKNIHSTDAGTSFLQSIDFFYDIQGKLTHINNADLDNDGTYNDDSDDLFGFELLYNNLGTITELGGTHQYNGNISAIVYNSDRQTQKHAYVYTYDDLNRLKTATYKEYGTNWTSATENDRFNVSDLTYDKNGNINTLERKGETAASTFGTMDDLTYYYVGNQLQAVNDAIAATTTTIDFDEINNREGSDTDPEYDYDANGNMIEDENKGITAVTYNILNLPSKVDFGSGDYIEYLYDAAGVKLQKKVYHNSSLSKTVDYLGGVQYEDDVLQFLTTGEGRVLYDNTGDTYTYQYFLKDHLGNNRITVQEDGNGDAEIVQEDEYYPFGLTFNGYVNGTENMYKTTGKELQTEHNLNMFDFEARFLDPQLGRWHVVDPIADNYLSWSPYNYVYNNPVNFIDPTGLGATDWYENSDGAIVWDENVKSQDDLEEGETYLGEEGYMVDDFGETQHLLNDGSMERVSRTVDLGDFAVNPSHSENNYTGYIYTDEDLALRHSIFHPKKKTLTNVLKAGILKDEAKGRFKPLTRSGADAYYGETSHRLLVFGNFLGMAIAVAPGGGLKGSVPRGGRLSARPLNTGRTGAESLNESMVMREVQSNPKLGSPINRLNNLSDPRWKGWTKMQYIRRDLSKSGGHTKVVIHYNAKFDASGNMIKVGDFKFDYSSTK